MPAALAWLQYLAYTRFALQLGVIALTTSSYAFLIMFHNEYDGVVGRAGRAP